MQAKKVRFFSSFALVLGLAVLALPVYGQGVAFQASSLPQQARFEGVTETMGAVVLQATGNGTVPYGSSITVAYSGTITNTTTATVINALSGAFAGVSCTGAGGPGATPQCAGDTNDVGTPTFAVTVSGNQLTVQITTAAAGPTSANTQMGFKTGDYIVISQVRVNVNALGAGTTTVNAQMSGTSSLPTSNPITFTNANVPVAAIINPSLAVKVTSGGSIQTCGIVAKLFTVKITENYPAALTSLADETGFTPSVLPAPVNGSNVTVTVTGVPSGISVQALSPVTNVTPLPGGSTAGGGTGTMTLTLSSGSAFQTSTGSGSLAWTFTVTGDATSVAENITLSFNIGILNSAGTAIGGGILPSIGTTVTPTATVSYSPVTGLPAAAADFATNTEGSGTVATIGDCVTNLLFPFITNQVGFDTSVQIANTTLDKLAFSSGNASPQSGTCTLSFYPTDLTTQTTSATGTLGTPSQFTTPVIPAGGVYSFQQSGSSFKTQSGYLFAVCRFVDAHGFSWVGNASPALGTSAATISQGLLALVIPNSEIGTGTGRTGSFAFFAGGTYESLAH